MARGLSEEIIDMFFEIFSCIVLEKLIFITARKNFRPIKTGEKTEVILHYGTPNLRPLSREYLYFRRQMIILDIPGNIVRQAVSNQFKPRLVALRYGELTVAFDFEISRAAINNRRSFSRLSNSATS